MASAFLMAQNYDAINGSSYAGSLGVGGNPASIVNVPYAWDITPVSVQVKQATNAITINKYSLLSSPKNAKVVVQNGDKKWFAFANQDIHLFNTRINLNSKAAIAFGANIRNYFYAAGSQANYIDTIHSLRDFLSLNVNNIPLSAQSVVSTWAELYGSYAQTIFEEGNRVLNAGITLKVNRNLAGGYGKAAGLSYIPATVNNEPGYLLTGGNLQYAYSSNFDAIDSNKSNSVNRKAFLQKTYSSISADIGFEYLILTDEDKEEGGDYAYETKIGLSVLDIGSNKYKRGNRSRLAVAGKGGITDSVIENKFTTINSVDDFNDSLASIANSITQLTGDFYIYQQTRLQINIDQHLANNFFINVAVTVPIINIAAKNSLYLKDMNLLAVTPRWELKAVGVYLPILLNNQHQLWVGGAFKAGPLLLGIHNLANLVSKNTTQNGGFYFAFTIRPGKKYDKDAHEPKDRSTGKTIRNLQCPKF